MPELRQAPGNAVATDQSRTCTVSMDQPTIEGSLVVIVSVAVHSSYGTYPVYLVGLAGFFLARTRTEDELTVSVWYRPACPSLSSVTVLSTGERSLQVRVLEYTGMAQANVLDRVAIGGDNDEFKPGSNTPRSGLTDLTSQADEVVLGVIANRYTSAQGGFVGGLAKVSESLTPRTWGNGNQDSDDRRSRLTVHNALTVATGQFSLSAQISAYVRDWVAVVLTFRGGTTGPARFTSIGQPPILRFGGSGDLTAFGPLISTGQSPILRFGAVHARIGPFNYQYRLGGWDGLLIGDGTDYRVESMEGLEGWQLRTSDENLPRGDGALRGVDLQSSRQVMVQLKVGGEQAQVERAMEILYAALVPQRDTDWDLIWRHPARPLRMLRCRPVDLIRELSWRETLVNHQSFLLRAADPRHYSAVVHELAIPVTPAGAGDAVAATSAPNMGNSRAHPVIRIVNRATFPISSVQLVNATVDVTFAVVTTIPPGGVLIGDMESLVTAAPRSTVTLDGQTKYGAWQLPREPFYLAPHPVAPDGANAVYLRTDPAGAPVKASIEYRDCWAG